jgi:hypothetical protein
MEPLKSLSVDTLGPIKNEKFGYQYIIVIVDNFSKFVQLYPTFSTTSEEYLNAMLQWVGLFGVPKEIRSDGGSQFASKLADDFKSLLGFQHLIVVAYHPKANGLVERRMHEVIKHLKAIVFEKRIKEEWSRYLPLVQRIMNYSIDGSIGTQPARVILGDLASEDLAMDLPSDEEGRNIGDYLVKLRDMHALIIKATQHYLEGNQRKRARNAEPRPLSVPNFHEGQYVLLQYPNRPPHKLAGLYRGPMVIQSIDRPDLIKVRDLLNNKISLVHTSRLRVFNHPADMTEEEATALAAVDLDEFYVEKIVGHTGTGRNPKRMEFKVRWLGYEPEDDTWMPWKSVKDLEALEVYARENNITLPE